jgi:hypothetical protein
VAIKALGSILALRDVDGKVCICDTSDNTMVAHFAIPKTASLDTFELVKVPLAGQQKGGYKLVWSTVNGNVKQISETHVYKATSESFTFENMYSVAKDATFSSSQVNGQSVFNDFLGKNGLSQYMFAQPT